MDGDVLNLSQSRASRAESTPVNGFKDPSLAPAVISKPLKFMGREGGDSFTKVSFNFV